MTDNEIIKALKSCISVGCKTCPLYTDATGTCIKRTMLNAHDLINRQKAEIERLNAKIKAKDEINYYNMGQLKVARDGIKTAKSEAIKEFVERLKEKGVLFDRDDIDYLENEGHLLLNTRVELYVSAETIDNLIKEMTEADK